ncbi:MAG: hypothetical protein KDE56_14665 [Anaerolineales bacterium]|nr:hypothetical protein [Anaerolineales bacterium]
MNDESKRTALRKYFKPPDTLMLPIVLFSLGVIFILIGLSAEEYGMVTLGIIIATGGGAWWYTASQQKGNLIPSDKEVDQWFQEDVQKIVEQSLGKLGLDESLLVREAIPITGPILWDVNGVAKEDLLWKKGKDDILRFAVNHITVLQFTDQVIAAYSCDFNFVKNVTLNDATNEFHYLDIVSVSTKEDSTSYTLPTGVSLTHSQAFRMSVSSGDTINIVIGAAELGKITGGGKVPTTAAEKAIQVIRTMLREKKR